MSPQELEIELDRVNAVLTELNRWDTGVVFNEHAATRIVRALDAATPPTEQESMTREELHGLINDYEQSLFGIYDDARTAIDKGEFVGVSHLQELAGEVRGEIARLRDLLKNGPIA